MLRIVWFSLIFFTIIKLSLADNYYWVHNTGRWVDTVNWATTSGGTIKHHQIPTENDNVIFDENSFTNNGQKVTLCPSGGCQPYHTFNLECNNLSVNNITHSIIIELQSSFRQLYVYGSININDSDVDIYGLLKVINETSADIFINKYDGIYPLNLELYGSGIYNLQSDLNKVDIKQFEGTFISNGHQMIKTALTSEGLNNRILDIRNSYIEAGGFSFKNTEYLTFLSDGSYIILNGLSLNTAGLSFPKLKFKYLPNVILPFQTIPLKIYGGGKIDTLIFEEFWWIEFGAGDTFEFQNIEFNANCILRSTVTSTKDGSLTYLKKDNGNFESDDIFLKDIAAIGGANFIANNSGILSNVINWGIANDTSKTFYWVNGSGNWLDPSKWSLTSGGASSGCIPGIDDDVIFDENSFNSPDTVTLYANSIGRNIDFSAIDELVFLRLPFGNFYINGSVTLSDKITTFVDLNASIDAEKTYFTSNEGGNTIETFGKKLFLSINFVGRGEWILLDSLDITRTAGGIVNKNAGKIALYSGTLNTNNQNIRANSFVASSPNNKVLNLGGSQVVIEGNALTTRKNLWMVENKDSFLINPGTSEIFITPNVIGNSFNEEDTIFNGGGLIYHNVEINKGGHIHGGGKFNKLTFNQTDNKKILFEAGQTFEFDTLIIPSGTDCKSYYTIQSNKLGSADPVIFKMTAPGNFQADYLLIDNINAIGGGVFTATNSIGIGDVSGWNIINDGSKTYYWINGRGDWYDTTHWSHSSGGSQHTGCVPTYLDTVIIDQNSFAAPSNLNGIYTVGNGLKSCKVFIVRQNHSFNTGMINVSKDLLIEGPIDSNSVHFNVTGNDSIHILKIPNHRLTLNLEGSGSYNLECSQQQIRTTIILKSGTLVTNNYDISGSIICENTGLNKRLTLGSSKINTSSWHINDPDNTSIDSSDHTIILQGHGGLYDVFKGGGLKYNKVLFKQYRKTSPVQPHLPSGISIYGSNSFNELNIDSMYGEVSFERGTEQRIEHLFAKGTAEYSIQFKSIVDVFNSGGRPIIYSDNDYCGDYLQIENVDAAGAIFKVGNNSISIGANTGWTFESCIDSIFPAFELDRDSICVSECLTIDNQTTGNVQSWNWTFEDGTPPNSNSENVTEVCFSSLGTKRIELTVSNTSNTQSIFKEVYVYNCDTTIIIIEPPVNNNSIQNINSYSLSIYPNPVNDNFFIIEPTVSLESIQLLMYDNLGRKVYEKKGSSNNSNKIIVDDFNLKNGIYLLEVIENKEKRFYHKFVLNR